MVLGEVQSDEKKKFFLMGDFFFALQVYNFSYSK